jgi:hypothetical protein
LELTIDLRSKRKYFHPAELVGGGVTLTAFTVKVAPLLVALLTLLVATIVYVAAALRLVLAIV